MKIDCNLRLTSVLFSLLLYGFGHAQSLEAQFDYALFQGEKNAFVETYISIDAKSVSYVVDDKNKLVATVLVNLSFLKDDQIISADKYLLTSPEINDTNDVNFVFIDQQRYFLEDGSYTFSLTLQDQNNLGNKLVHKELINVKKQDGLSSVQFIDRYYESKQASIVSKSGYDLIPFISNFYNENNDTLNFYFEYYNSKSEVVLLQTKILSQSTNRVVNNLAISKKSSGRKTPMLASFSLNNVPTGTYYLVVNAINNANELVDSTKKLFFKMNQGVKQNRVDISNSFASFLNNKDTLSLYINYLYPIQSVSESIYADNQLSVDSLELMQSYFYEFWNRRDPFNTESTWLQYLQNVRAVNAKYGNGLKAGYLTDRGRIYLAHGKPNTISEEYLPRQFHPFEVWHYHKIGQERNVKFIFTNDRMPNEYRLIYSNKQGESSSFSDWNQRFNSDYHDTYDPVIDSPLDYFRNPK